MGLYRLRDKCGFYDAIIIYTLKKKIYIYIYLGAIFILKL